MKFWFVLLLFVSKFTFSLSIDEKIEKLYDVTESKQNLISHTKEIKEYCKYLEKYNKLSLHKRIKKIFSETKKMYLTNYSLGSFFSDLHSNNTYNCVTGSALFAIIFDELDIPYEVVSIPRHVYLVCYPESETVTVDATLGEKSDLYFWTESSVSNAINFLITTEQVTEGQVRLLGASLVMEKYFYTSSKLNFISLVGYQHFNKSLYYNELSMYTNAYDEINKALHINNNQEGVLVKSMILDHLVSESSVVDIEQVNYLTEFYQLSNSITKRESILYRFRYLIYEAFNERKDKLYTDSVLTLIDQNLITNEDKYVFLGYYEFANSAYLLNESRYNSALKSCKRGYEYSNESSIFEELFVQIYLNRIWEDFDDEDVLIQMDQLSIEHPFLMNNFQYKKIYLAYFAEKVCDFYDSNNYEEGEVVYEDFQELILDLESDEVDDLNSVLDDINIDIYSSISTYHYRQKNYSIALLWINKALIIDSKADYLIRKKGYIERKM